MAVFISASRNAHYMKLKKQWDIISYNTIAERTPPIKLSRVDNHPYLNFLHCIIGKKIPNYKRFSFAKRLYRKKYGNENLNWR